MLSFSDELMMQEVRRCCSHYVAPLTSIHPATQVAINARIPSGWFLTYCPSTKSLVIGGSVIGFVIFLWRNRSTVRGILGIGPYASADTGCLRRSLQRSLMTSTRKELDVSMFPLQSFIEPDPRRVSDNGHALSGAVRDSARKLIKNAVVAAGYTKYEISPAKQSYDGGNVAHQHYAPSDFFLGVRDDVPSPKDCIVGIDVDYYVQDFSRFLGYENPALFFTFSPLTVSGIDGDSPFRIKDNRVVYQVGGGGNWEHEVWNWFAYGEFIEFPYQERSWIGRIRSWVLGAIGVRKHIIHKVHHARLWKQMPNRGLVWCLPQFTYWKFSWLPSEMNAARSLARVNYKCANKPGWNAIIDQSSGIPKISFGREDEDLQVTIDKSVHDLCMGCQTGHSVTARLLSLQIKEPVAMALLGQYYLGKPIEQANFERVGRSVQPLVHWPASFEADEPEISARAYSHPVVDDANMFPMIKRWESLSDSLEARVTRVANDKTPPARYMQLAAEFVEMVVPSPGAGTPYDLETTAGMLDKPSQVLAVKQIWETADVEVRRMIECFVKNEPCQKPGRIISSFPDMRYLLRFSSFSLAFRDEVLHSELHEHWFCPGNNPSQIAEKVVHYVRAVQEPIEGDYANFDGTVSTWCQRNVMNAVYHRYFHESHQKELRSYTDMLVSCPARSKRFGFKYEAGVGVKSGSPTTCDLNTVLNAFIQYAAVRLADPHLPREDAFRRIGLCFGDDSLFERQYQKWFCIVAKHLGMDVKVERYDPAAGITFLARVYPDPFTTTTTFQDPLRTWKKLHLTTRDPNVPIGDAAVDRVEGYEVTDGLSPIVGSFVRMIKRVYSTCNTLEVRRKRKSCDKEKPYWLTTGGAWPQAEKDVELMFQVAAYRCGTDVEKLRAFDRKLQDSNTAWFEQVIPRESQSPYSGTLAPDGLPLGDVDMRLIQHERQTHHSRSNATIAKQLASPAKSVQSKTRNDPRRAIQSGIGSGQLSSHAKINNGEISKSARQPNQQTIDQSLFRQRRRSGKRGASERSQQHSARNERSFQRTPTKPRPHSPTRARNPSGISNPNQPGTSAGSDRSRHQK